MNYDMRIKKIMDNDRDQYKKTISLINALRKELSKFNYGGDFRNLSHFLIKINEIIPKLPNKKQNLVNAEIVGLHRVVRTLIIDRPSYVTKENPNFLELKIIIDNLEAMNLSYMYNYMDKYDGNAYNLFKYLLFDEKNLFFVKHALEKYPYFVNIRDEHGNEIIGDVVDKYLEAIDKYIKSNLLLSDDLYYYDQVLEEMLKSTKFNYTMISEKKNLQKINHFLDNYDCSTINGEVKNKLIFWINELKNKIEEKHYSETLAHLSYKTDIAIDFNEAILSETRRFEIGNIRDAYKKREYVRDEYIITVDGEGAEEIDDGLSVKILPNGNYLLGVHISDPSGYLSKSSILYDEAYHRTTSIYSPLERTSSMFPEVYAKDYMSLTEGSNRFCTSYYLEITPQGDIILDRCTFKKTIVNVDKKLTYDEFNSLVENVNENERLSETIITLQEVADILSNVIRVDENYRLANRHTTNASGTNITGNSNSEKIIEYAMIVANATVANYMAKRDFPFIYRGHELNKDYLEKIDYFDRKFRENPTCENYDVFVRILKNTYPTAFYTTDNKIGHMGIGIPHYCHITSPLRRFADCLANEALELFYFNNTNDDKVVYAFEDRLKEGCRHINEKKKTIDYFTDRYVKIKNCDDE